jgi:hypothetical protein
MVALGLPARKSDLFFSGQSDCMPLEIKTDDLVGGGDGRTQ